MSLIVGPLVPPELKPLLAAMVESIRALQTQAHPTKLFACTVTGLPDAARHPACAVLLTDLNRIAISDGDNWIRQDTGAVL